MQPLKELFEETRAYFFKFTNAHTNEGYESRIFREVEDAKREWKNSLSYFNDVTDAELIDYAIYTMGAAEHRYAYLLRKAKKELGFKKSDVV